MSTRTKKPNLSPVPENPNALTTADLYRLHDGSMRDEIKKAEEAKELNRNKAEEKRKDVVESYAKKLKYIDDQKVDDPKEIDLKIKDLKELEVQIQEEIVYQQKKKTEFVDEIFANGESLVKEIEEKRVEEKTGKSIFRKLIDFLFGF